MSDLESRVDQASDDAAARAEELQGEAEQTTDEAVGAATEAAEDIQAQAEAASSQATGAAEEMGSKAGEAAHGLLERAGDVLDDAKGFLSRLTGKGKSDA